MQVIIICIQIILWWAVLLGVAGTWAKKRFGPGKAGQLIKLISMCMAVVTLLTAVLLFAAHVDRQTRKEFHAGSMEAVEKEDGTDSMEGQAAVQTARERQWEIVEVRKNLGMQGFWVVSSSAGTDGQMFRMIQMFVCSILLITGYIMTFYKKGEMVFYILQVAFMILVPLIGPIFLILSWMIQKIFFTKEINLEELSFKKDTLRVIMRPDEEKERNVVPVKEALLVSDTQDKRRVMLDVLKGEYEKSLTVITDALENPDTEISHYAASVITEVKSNFKLMVQTMQEQLKDYPDDAAMKVILIRYIHDFLEKGVLSNIEAMTYITIYLKLMEDLFTLDPMSVTGMMYKDIIQHLLEAQDKNDAEKWVRRAMEYASGELAAYKGVLKYYYETGNKEAFFNTLEQLKKSDVVLDKETLETVRLFG